MKYNLMILSLLVLVSCTPKPANNSGKQHPRPTQHVKSNTGNQKRATPSSSPTKFSAEKIYQKCNPAVFTVLTENDIVQSQGSGFFISPTGLAVSNYHVFKGTYKGLELIYMADGTQYKVKEVLHHDENEDFILFRVNTNNQKVPYLKVTSRRPIIGNKIFAIGSPRGFTNTLSTGEISQLRGDYFIQINAPIDHGSSGGALINEYGEVIGITSGGRDDSGANLNYAIDISVVKPYIPTRK